MLRNIIILGGMPFEHKIKHYRDIVYKKKIQIKGGRRGRVISRNYMYSWMKITYPKSCPLSRLINHLLPRER